MELIDDVVHDPDVTVTLSASSSADDDLEDAMDDGESAGDSIDILGRLLTINERFRRKINERHLRQELQKVCTSASVARCNCYTRRLSDLAPQPIMHSCFRPFTGFYAQVEAAGERLQDSLSDAWEIVRIPQRPESPKQRASLVHDRVNNVSRENDECTICSLQ